MSFLIKRSLEFWQMIIQRLGQIVEYACWTDGFEIGIGSINIHTRYAMNKSGSERKSGPVMAASWAMYSSEDSTVCLLSASQPTPHTKDWYNCLWVKWGTMVCGYEWLLKLEWRLQPRQVIRRYSSVNTMPRSTMGVASMGAMTSPLHWFEKVLKQLVH